MCGILLSTNPLNDRELIQKITNRGPDYQSAPPFNVQGINFFSSVLSLRSPFTQQPLVNDDYVIQFNGELYNEDIQGNDTQWIQASLRTTNSIKQTLNGMDGEYAIAIYQKSTRLVSFGRDPIGKRSLVYSINDKQLTVSSVHPVIDREHYTDCLAGVIYQYHLDHHTLTTIDNDIHYTINTSVDVDYEHLDQRLNQLQDILTHSVNQRIKTIQPFHIVDPHIDSLYSILFSGGLDCTVIAGLSASLSPPNTVIDLLNVAFDNPRTGMTASQAPDRILAIQSWRELCAVYPHVQFNLIEIDVSYEEYQTMRPRVIELMYPKDTEMDLSIAIAFYFASRGEGVRLELLTSQGTIKRHAEYKSKSKVLLSGLGADELFGGYHKLANKDLDTLPSELSRQINNIHERNLMRDDKVIADNGVEVRYPFLSHSMIKFTTESIEINYKISKFILRQLATRIGLPFVSQEPKRAIQFGAKSAKITASQSGKTRGTDSLS